MKTVPVSTMPSQLRHIDAHTPRPATADLAELPDSALIQAHHRFAFKLWAGLLEQNPQGNLFFSPLSLSVILALLAQGAQAKTRAEIETVLEIKDIPTERMLKDTRTLMRYLQLQGRGVELRLANSLWLAEQFSLAPLFQQLAREVFSAEVSSLDFSVASSLRQINAWASEQTRGRIPSILGILDSNTLLLMLNAIWFKGSWQEPFRPELTRDEPFARPGQAEHSTPMMVQRMECRHRDYAGTCQILALNYGLEAQAGFYALLPAPGVSLADLIAELTPENWEQWRLGLYSRTVTVHLPRFRMDWEAELNGVLQTLGLQRIFMPDPGLDRMLAEDIPLQVSLIKQKSFVEFNEEGTEAAAVTAIAQRAAAMPPPPLEMRLDRPFLFLIVDEWSGSLLFAGCLNDPEQVS